MSIERDVQMDRDDREVTIQEVGICDLKQSLVWTGLEIDETVGQRVSATLSLAVSLNKELKGIHMSRLVEDLLETNEQLGVQELYCLLMRLKDHQEARDARLSLSFDYYLDRQAPVSGRIAKQPYACRYEGRLEGSRITIVQNVEVPVPTLCPCSKEISSYGAHNQRGYVEVELEHHFTVEQELDIRIPLEEVIEAVESLASAPLYPVLKRVDERFVTMQAYDAPRFVEDMVRDVAVFLRKDKRSDRWRVRVTNHESIHQHNAYAVVSGEH
jgi:GTP cyclohydrolase I